MPEVGIDGYCFYVKPENVLSLPCEVRRKLCRGSVNRQCPQLGERRKVAINAVSDEKLRSVERSNIGVAI